MANVSAVAQDRTVHPHRELDFARLLPSLSAGLVIGLLTVNLEISFATLIFSGPLSTYLAQGIGLMLFGAVVIGAVVALTSSYPGSIAFPISNPVPILALMAAAVVSKLSASAGDAEMATVTAAIGATSVLTGAVLLALGRFRWGFLIRFVPYPVVGGFLAGTGWLVVQGAIGTMAGVALVPSNLGSFPQPEVLAHWVPGVTFGLVLLFVLRRHKHFLLLPGLLVSGILLFDGWLWATHTSVADAVAQGWLLGLFPSGTLWQPATTLALTQADWPLVASQADKIGTVLVITIVGLLLNSTGLELAVRRDVDLNRELESAGAGNLLAGLGGAAVGFQSLSFSLIGARMGANSRLIGLVSATLCALFLFFGASLLTFLPKPILAGLLFYLGLLFLVDWLYEGWFKLSRTDYALIVVILGIIASVGFLQGIAAGVAIAATLFLVNYSRVDVIKHTLSGANFHSTVDRPAAQRQSLRAHGEQIHFLQLQGFLFFGTAFSLLNEVRRRLEAPDLRPLRFLVLDFCRTSGLDSSAISSFRRLEQLAASKNVRLVLTDLAVPMRRQLIKGGLGSEGRDVLHFQPTMDEGMEWCEEQLLADSREAHSKIPDTLQAHLEQIFTSSEEVARLQSYLERMQVKEGEQIVRQGGVPDALYFLESGSAAAYYDLADGRTIRLRTMHCGTIVGEVGVYLGTARTASVQALEPTTLYRLSVDRIKEMEVRDPEVASALHKAIARLMAERLGDNNNMFAALVE